MPADHANIAAAGSRLHRQRHDRGASSPLPRYRTVLEKWLVGDTGQCGFNLRAYGDSNSSAGAADTAALAALNAQRAHRYAGKGPNGGTLAVDLH